MQLNLCWGNFIPLNTYITNEKNFKTLIQVSISRVEEQNKSKASRKKEIIKNRNQGHWKGKKKNG